MSEGTVFALIVYAMFPTAIVVSLAIYLWKERKTPARKRDPPLGRLLKDVGWILLFLLAGPPLAALLFFGSVVWLTPYMANPKDAPFAVAAAGFGLLISLAATIWTKIARQACKWPVTRGRIVSARVEATLRRRRKMFYKASVRYTYQVGGRKYSGHRLRLGGAVSATVAHFAEETVAKYPVGTEVDVHYNPQNPDESVLHPHSLGHYLLWVIAACLFALASAVATGLVVR